MPCLLRQILLISLCLINTGHADYVLVLSPDKLAIGITEDINLECRFRDSQSSSAFNSISRLRILKETSPTNYEIIAEVREDESEIHDSLISGIITGNIGNVSSSYIQISWKLATSDILGNYRCDIIGYKVNQDILVEKTPVVAIIGSFVTIEDVFHLALKQKADIQQKIQDQKAYCDRQVTTAEQNLTASLLAIESDRNSSSQIFTKSYLAQIAQLTASLNRIKATGVFQYWPEGSYGLLMPDTGCPDSVGAQWSNGYRKFHTESTDRNYDNVSDPAHLPKPTMERIDTDNFMYQYFCVSKVRSPGPAWPRGSYCINRVGGVCPSGFSSGFITWQDEVTNSKASSSGLLPDGNYPINSTSVYYCCRTDGSPDKPIYLPKNRPFYLYRYNGKCQEVLEMRSSTGDMTFDTDNGKGDAYENTYHPDGSVDNVHIELCYYS